MTLSSDSKLFRPLNPFIVNPVMKRKFILFALPLFLLLGCTEGGTSEASELEGLEATVLAKHDSAMSLMGDIFKLRRNLRTLRDTLAAQETDTATVLALQQQIEGLNGADKVMMEWMHNYEAPDSLQHEQAMTYLQQELQKIDRVQIVMDSTIAAAQQTYKTYEQQQ